MLAPLATIESINVIVQGIIYAVYPGGQVPICPAGVNFDVETSVRNQGPEGIIIVELRDDTTNALLATDTDYISSFNTLDSIFTLTMPNRDWPLRFDAGH